MSYHSIEVADGDPFLIGVRRIKAMSAPSIEIADGTVIYTDRDGRTYTAPDANVEAGDSVAVEWSVATPGPYLAVTRGEVVTRYPLRDEAGFHIEDLRAALLVPCNPFLPDAGGSNP